MLTDQQVVSDFQVASSMKIKTKYSPEIISIRLVTNFFNDQALLQLVSFRSSVLMDIRDIDLVMLEPFYRSKILH